MSIIKSRNYPVDLNELKHPERRFRRWLDYNINKREEKVSYTIEDMEKAYLGGFYTHSEIIGGADPFGNFGISREYKPNPMLNPNRNWVDLTEHFSRFMHTPTALLEKAECIVATSFIFLSTNELKSFIDQHGKNWVFYYDSTIENGSEGEFFIVRMGISTDMSLRKYILNNDLDVSPEDYEYGEWTRG